MLLKMLQKGFVNGVMQEKTFKRNFSKKKKFWPTLMHGHSAGRDPRFRTVVDLRVYAFYRSWHNSYSQARFLIAQL